MPTSGLGARSLAGDILLHPQYGYMYYASCFTELALPPDKPLLENPCPAPSCVNMFRQEGRTPCMKFCPAQCLSGEIDAAGKQASMHYDMAACELARPSRLFRSYCVTQSRPMIPRHVRSCCWVSATKCFGTE